MFNSVAQFVDRFFHKLLFRSDDSIAAESISSELFTDALIKYALSFCIPPSETQPCFSCSINGNALTAAIFESLIKEQFRGTQTAVENSVVDLNFAPSNETGRTGVIAQIRKYTTTAKADGKEVPQTATTLVQVEEKEGKLVIVGLFEVQSVDQEGN